jgi:Mn2+/Fe2+ NRAMP family transporter
MRPRNSPSPSTNRAAAEAIAEERLGRGAQKKVEAHERLSAREMLSILGPGVVSGSADNDPAGITTYSVVGAQSGYSQNWLLLLASPLLIVV